MGITASQENFRAVVQIKRAGGYLEEICRPITAQELMLHNPKHWVTKPGVFKALNPVVEVVPPEVVLTPGQTFLLVPFTTMQSLLERQRMCPASLDHLMERPGLALPDWYYQQHGKVVSKVCPMKDCKCIYAKERSSKSSLSEPSMVAHTHILAESGCPRVAKVNTTTETSLLSCQNALRGAEEYPLSKDVLGRSSNDSIDVTSLCSGKNNAGRVGVDPLSKDVLHRLSNEGIDATLVSSGKGKNQQEEKKRWTRTKRLRRGKDGKKQGTVSYPAGSMSQQVIEKRFEHPSANKVTEESKAQETSEKFLRQRDFSKSDSVQKGSEESIGNGSFIQFLLACFCYPATNGGKVYKVSSSRKGLVSRGRVRRHDSHV
ncbi:hypothetical protein GOP47_0006717 [Adiantum capillus-veneris]|uniref:Uncharacterized protein n=1 Tax=Adiantum capillus-veneris TaxID=13818 RepID=A0A9D4ZMR7_ADICA|nr:hypothetical protein GOP47_0006717 [Adiantum capillus-veneris]